MLLLEGNVLDGKFVLTERGGGSDKRTVTIESCPGIFRCSIGDFMVGSLVVGDATGVACEDGLLCSSSGTVSMVTKDMDESADLACQDGWWELECRIFDSQECRCPLFPTIYR